MAKQVFINLPVSDLAASTKFYEALGFTKYEGFSDENASAMQWTDDIVFMLLTREYYAKFLEGKAVADTQATSGALIALSCDSKEAVQEFADTAKAHDGNTLEPVWMDPNFEG